MEMTIDMPYVAECSATECAYNMGERCHARAITIGDGVHPGCDTFLKATVHTQERQHIAGVGACKVTACLHNEDYECCADHVDVGLEDDTVRCMSYARAE